jgi:flagellar biosynthetic protein FliR
VDLDLYNWFLVFVRMGAFLLALPFFSAVNFPATMRVALAALTALLLAPQLPPFHLQHLDLVSFVGLFVREVGIGLLLGFIGRMAFYAADIAGLLISTELGLNMGQIMDPTSKQTEMVPGLMLFFLATLTMLTLDLHHGLLLGLARTFEVLPLGGGHLSAPLFEVVVQRCAGVFTTALQIAAPAIATSFVITVFFSVMGRAVPQMNVFAESFGLKIAGGLIVFGFTLQITSQYIANQLRRLPDDLVGLAQLLNGG